MHQDASQVSIQAQAEWRLKSQYSDFDAVVTTDNINKLAAAKPSLAKSMFANPDLYEKGQTAYELIKTFVANEDYAVQDRKIEDNKTKPRAAGSASGQVAETPLTRTADYDRQQVAQARRYN